MQRRLSIEGSMCVLVGGQSCAGYHEVSWYGGLEWSGRVFQAGEGSGCGGSRM